MELQEGMGKKFGELVERRRVDTFSLSILSRTYFCTARITVKTIVARGPVIPTSIPTGGKNPKSTSTRPPIGCGGMLTTEPVISLSVMLGGGGMPMAQPVMPSSVLSSREQFPSRKR